MLLANVIWPTTLTPYLARILCPVATIGALVAEFLVVRHLQRGVIRGSYALFLVIAVNAFSWLTGGLLSLLCPIPLYHTLESMTGTPSTLAFYLIHLASFPYACVPSVGLEYAALRWFFWETRLRRPLRTLVLANVVSYSVMMVLVMIHWYVLWYAPQVYD